MSDTRMVVRTDGNSYRILHDRAVRLAIGSNLDNWDALVQYHQRLERMNVTTRSPSRRSQVRRRDTGWRMGVRVAMIARRVVVFGGTFDPVHNGHIAIAKCLRDQLEAESVVMGPNRTPMASSQHTNRHTI